MSGRPHSPGLKYFPVDVDIFRNSKILDLKEDYRSEGLLFYMQLLATIYSKGNYMVWERSNIRDFRQAYEYTDAQIKMYIDAIVNINLLNKPLFEKYNILTSDAIQERYLYSTKKRERISYVKEYLLIKFENYRSIPQPVCILDLNGEVIETILKAPDQKYVKKSLRKDPIPIKTIAEPPPPPPKPKTVIPDGFEQEIDEHHYFDEVLTKDVLDLFGLGGMYRSTEKSLFKEFTTVLNNKGNLDEFRTQFKAYKEYQLLSEKEFLHIFENFIGHQSECFEDGKWSKTNWVNKLKSKLSKKQNSNGKTHSRGYTPEAGYGQI